MTPPIIERPSPNHDARPGDAILSMFVLHYTDMANATAALDRMCDPLAKVSAHYLVDDDGTIYRLVPEARRAWHAGKSHWRGIEGLNAVSIGIELANPGHSLGYRAFPPTQMTALRVLAHDIVARHAIPPRNVIGHSDVAPERKLDPGELFDWRDLARQGIGLWPEPLSEIVSTDPLLREGDEGPRIARLQSALKHYGYGLTEDARFGPHTASVVRAFQRHFRPAQIDGIWDADCAARLKLLLARAGEPIAP